MGLGAHPVGFPTLGVHPGDVDIHVGLVNAVLEAAECLAKRLAPLDGRLEHLADQGDLEHRVHLGLGPDRFDQVDHHRFPVDPAGVLEEHRLEPGRDLGLGRDVGLLDPVGDDLGGPLFAVESGQVAERLGGRRGLLGQVVVSARLRERGLDGHHPEVVDQQVGEELLELAQRPSPSALRWATASMDRS